MSDQQKRENRALYRLAREPELGTRQLWVIGANDATISTLAAAGYIVNTTRKSYRTRLARANGARWMLTPAGQAEIEARYARCEHATC